MSAVDISVIFAFVAALAWGLSDFFGAKASKDVGPILSVLLIDWLELFIFIIFYLIAGYHFHANLVAILYASLAGFVFSLSGAFFFIGLKKGPVSLVSPISGTYPLFTTLIVVSVFGARLTLIEIVGIILVIIGVMAASGLFNYKKKQRLLSDGVKIALLTSVIWGLGFALLTQAINHSDWQNAAVIELTAISVFTAVLIVPVFKGQETISLKAINNALRNNFIWLNTLIGLVGVILIYVALSKSNSNGGAIPTAVSSISPLITSMMALKHFKEKVNTLALAGAFLSVVGVVVLSI